MQKHEQQAISEHALELLSGIGDELQREYFEQWIAGNAEGDRMLRAKASVMVDVLGAVRGRINQGIDARGGDNE